MFFFAFWMNLRAYLRMQHALARNALQDVLRKKLPYELELYIFDIVHKDHKQEKECFEKWCKRVNRLNAEHVCLRANFVQGWLEHEEQFVFPFDYDTWMEVYMNGLDNSNALFSSFERCLFKLNGDLFDEVKNEVIKLLREYDDYEPIVSSISETHWNFVALSNIYNEYMRTHVLPKLTIKRQYEDYRWLRQKKHEEWLAKFRHDNYE